MKKSLLLATLISAAPIANAQFSVSPNPGPPVEAPALGGINLVIDDGTAENSVGLTAGGQFFWFNRFTPPVGDFPLGVQDVSVFFQSTSGVTIGDLIDLYVYSDPDGNPANGATFVGSLTGQPVMTLDAFNMYTFPAPLPIATSGDILIGVVNRGIAAQGEFPAAIDQTPTSNRRSWIALYGGSPPPNPPTLPAPTLAIIDDLAATLAGDWMIRGSYLSPTAGEEGGRARRVALGVSAPNPVVSGRAVIPFEVREAGTVRLAVYDVLGREVAVLADGAFATGPHAATLEAARLPAGAYIVRLSTADEAVTSRVTVVR